MRASFSVIDTLFDTALFRMRSCDCLAHASDLSEDRCYGAYYCAQANRKPNRNPCRNRLAQVEDAWRDMSGICKTGN
jgi:hypothetical protein